MREGDHEYYIIQHRTTHRSEHLAKVHKLKPVKRDRWQGSCFDYFHLTGPLKPLKDGCRFGKHSDEAHEVWAKTGERGYWSLKTARACLKHVRKLDKEDAYASRGPYKELCSLMRHEFRVVKIVGRKHTTVVSEKKKVKV